MSSRSPTPANKITIHAAVLAGGRSSRMKTDKRFLVLNGETLIDHAVRVASQVAHPYQGQVFLCGDVPERECLLDSIANVGPIAGVLSALEAMEHTQRSVGSVWLAVMPVDMPLLESNVFEPLVEAALQAVPTTGVVGFEAREMPFLVRAGFRARTVTGALCKVGSARVRSLRALQDFLGRQNVRLTQELELSMENANSPQDWGRICIRGLA